VSPARRPEFQALLIFLAVALPVLFFGWLLKTILFPVLIASVLYVLLEPAVSLLQRRGINKTLAITLVLLGVIALLVWFVVAVVPMVTDQFTVFRERLPTAWENIARLAEQMQVWLNQSLGISLQADTLLPSASALVQHTSSRILGGASGLVANVALWLLLIPAVSFFLLRDYRSLRNTLISLAPNQIFEKSLMIYHKVASQLELYVRSVMLQSLIMAAVTGIGFALIGLPMAPLLGILAGVFNLIPYIGPLLGLVAPLLVALSLGTDPGLLMATVAVVVVGQLNDNLVVVPTVLARAANLHPLIALLAIIVAGSLFGLPGMVFALPVLASARIVYAGVLAELRQASRRSVAARA
jgi:putative permease